MSEKLSLGVLLACAVLTAQNPYGRITGRVHDSAEAVIPSASIHVRNLDTNVVVNLLSNEEGNYEAPDLNPGNYQVSVEITGFKRYDRGPLELHIGDVLTVDVILELGSVSETVIVTASAPLLESANANLGQIVDHREIEDLPLPAGSPMYLLQMTPGMFATTAPTAPWLPNAVDSVSGMGGSGVRARSSEFSLDGTPNMTQGGQTAFVPPPEMLQEVRIDTAPFDASLGHFTGAHVNMAVKSGTNTVHGDLYFSHMSTPLMAHNFFTNRAIYDTSTGPVTDEKIKSLWPATRLNHYRASAAGPFYIPRMYDGRNRTFWTFGVDDLYRLKNEPDTVTVPTAAERQGNFSALLAIGSQYQIYDPATIAPAPGGRFSRQPLPGNLIPASRLDSMAKKLLNYYPLPNLTGTSNGTDNYYAPEPRSGPYLGAIGRLDRIVNDNNRFYATYSQSATDVKSGQPFTNIATGVLLDRRYHGFSLNDVAVLRPNLLLDLRAGFTRYQTFSRPVSFGTNLASLGFADSLVSKLDPALTSFPNITIDGMAPLSGDGGSRNPTMYYNFAATLSHMRGSHSLRFGVDFRILQENNYAYGNVAPKIDFASAWTKGPLDNSAAAPIGQALASFLFGLPTGGNIDVNSSYAQQSRYLAGFAQDDWKIARRLTLNLGVRYELDLPVTERYNRTTRGFDFADPNPIQNAARNNYALSPIAEIPVNSFQTRGGLLFAGANGQPRGIMDAQTLQVAPRVGLAYQLRPRTVLRAGYGIFYDSLGGDQFNVKQQGFNQTTNLQPSPDNGLTFRGTLSNPFPDGWLQPVGAAAGLATYVGRGPGFFWPSRRTPYMQRWSFSIQQQIRNVLVEAPYVGNRGTRLGVNEQIDAVPRQYLSTSAVRDTPTINFLTAAVPNPFLGLPEFAGGGLQTKTVQRLQLLRPYPQYTGLTSTLDGGMSWYHSLQLRARKRFSRGFTIQASYTWSKFMEAVERRDPTDSIPEHVISPQDRPRVFVVSGIYELPFGRGKRWFDRIAGGWTIQGIYQGQSGPPLAFGNVLFYGAIQNIPLPVSERTVDRWFNTADFERTSGKQLAQNIQTFPTRLNNVRGDGFNNFNLSLMKNIRIRESLRLQLRGEAVDALNHPMFAAPNMTPTNQNFGKVTSVNADQQRQISVGAKLRF
jgi:hypothetical protein